MPLNVVMIGPRACGKTSTLSVMLHDVEQFISNLTAQDPQFQVTECLPQLSMTSQMAKQRLLDGYSQLNNLVREAQRSVGNIDMLAGELIGDTGSTTYSIDFQIGDVADKINFWDFPGGFFSGRFITKGRFSQDKDDWERIINNADIILLAVDASFQLQPRGKLKCDETYYERIVELIKKSISNAGTSIKMLVYMPVKCEHMVLDASYDSLDDEIDLRFNEDKCETLKTKVVDLFPGLFDFCKENRNRVDVFFAPMITVGGITCKGIVMDDSRFEEVGLMAKVAFGPILEKYYHRTPFRPMNCDRVFALCLLKMREAMASAWAHEHPIMNFLSWFFDNPVHVFLDQLSRSIGMEKMLGEYILNHFGDFRDLPKEDRQNLRIAAEKLIQESPSTNGCAWLN